MKNTAKIEDLEEISRRIVNDVLAKCGSKDFSFDLHVTKYTDVSAEEGMHSCAEFEISGSIDVRDEGTDNDKWKVQRWLNATLTVTERWGAVK